MDWPGPAGPRIRTTTGVMPLSGWASGGCWTAAFVSHKNNAGRDLAALPRFSGIIDLSEDLTDFGEPRR